MKKLNADKPVLVRPEGYEGHAFSPALPRLASTGQLPMLAVAESGWSAAGL
jgi:hypothetical protein